MENSSEKNIKIGAILTYITQFLSIAISFVYVPIMLNQLGQAEYGLYSIVQSLIAYLQMSEMGIGTTATRYNAKYIADNDTNGQKTINGMFFKMYMGIAAVCAIVATVLYFCLDGIYADYSAESLRLIKVLFVIAVINLIITFVFKIFNAIVIAYEEYIFLKIITLIQTLLGPIGMLTVLFLGFRSIGMLCVTTALSLVFGLTQMFFCLRKYKVRFTMKGHDPAIFKRILSFTLFVFVNSMANQLMNNSDKVVISIIMTEYAVAIYAVVMQFQTYSYNFSNVLSGFYLPRYTKMIAREKKISGELFEDLVKTGRLQVIVAGLIFGGFLAIGKPFILRWVGSDYSEAYLLTVLVLLTELVGASQSVFNSLMQAMNLHKMRAFISLSAATFKIILTVILTMQFGLMGCAIAFVIGWTVRTIAFNLYYARRVKINISRFWLRMMRLYIPLTVVIVGLYAVSQFVLRLLPATGYPMLIAYVLTYTAAYGGLLYAFILNPYEKSLLASAFRKFRRRK